MSKIHDTESSPGLTFHEKSAWITLVSIVVVYAYYFWRVAQIGKGDPEHVGALFGRTVVVMVAIETVAHTVVGVRRRPEPTDERDRRIALLATRNGYYVMMTGLWCASFAVVLALGTFWLAHAVLLAIVLAEVTRLGTQLLYYRRGLQPW